MPYVTEDRKIDIEDGSSMKSAGDLNYVLTTVVVDYLLSNGLSYETLAEITAALDDCKDEFKRRVQVPYEKRKIRENGDVYPEEFLGVPSDRA